ncbi:integrase [Noviherbaspirillum denitrificans]|uniref:Integrase n=2 Tax=Noviherbaspirillum denitrificans TaxID=1968433 RepID=A0A254T5S5_9BURK|nr:integrase [Noviherbaspirillum denitrificans]
MLAHVRSSIEVTRLDFDTPMGKKALHEQEVEMFVTERNHKIILAAMNDIVYQIIATILWVTGLRPRDLFQLPYRGKEQNNGFIPYDADEIPDDLDQQEITYWFRSKGKHRSIQFPGLLWRAICELYIPVRRERADLHFAKYGISPSNSALFLAANGEIVNADRLRHAFSKAVQKSRALPLGVAGHGFTGRKYTPRMLRHSCATYFVYEHLKRNKLLGRPYQYDPSVDDRLRRMLGHEDVGTTYKYYVHLVIRFHNDDLLRDLKNSHVNQALSALLEVMNY